MGGGGNYFTDKESCKRNKIRTDNMWYVKRVFFCSHTEYIKLEGKSKSIAHTQVDFKVLVMSITNNSCTNYTVVPFQRIEIV